MVRTAVRVRRSEKLAQRGRVSQVVLVTVDLPWPFSAREVVLDACGVDDIDATGDNASWSGRSARTRTATRAMTRLE